MAYTYTVSGDFSSGVDIGQLRTEIKDNVSITSNVANIKKSGDNIHIYFKSTLDGSSMTALDAVVAAHVPDPSLEGTEIQGAGRLYKKSGDISVYWKPDGGSEVNLTEPNTTTLSAASTDTVTSSSGNWLEINGMSVTASSAGTYLISLNTSVEISNKSGICEVVFYKNGTIINGPVSSCGEESAIYPLALSTVQTLDANDVIKVYARLSVQKGNYKMYYRQLTLIRI